ncbi:MAG: MBL fold metallo-hydrolase [Chloroherpetonaceae bacterium]|nr:MBL fold metallo-hydrolase [Chloroherpetonaceae bacterium]MCS7211214.1 MBL fold metallo-hydrolase [Chloroherpetonaceae bacterium]MDW8019971.1 MBL fold metallo-hydrolase [Chloroherpetonaceae bacterium]MDW8467532.1 MBL fold metallo-hydrolase [Chloroherpetonaceae bacterium]
MKITLLGSGTSQGIPVPLCQCRVCTSTDPRDKRLRCSAWVEVGNLSIVIDTSIDFRQQVLRSRVPRIDAVLQTHHHFDHLFGLDDIRAFSNAQQAPIDFYTSPQCEPEVMSRFGYAFGEQNLKWGLPALKMHVVDAPFTIEKNGDSVLVTPIDVGHGKLMIYGYRIGNFAYLTDCKTLPEHSFERLKGLELLVIDCLRLTPHPTHACLSETLSHIERIQPQRAVLIHMSHEVSHAELEAMLPEHITVGYDEMEIILD